MQLGPMFYLALLFDDRVGLERKLSASLSVDFVELHFPAQLDPK
jgi:hypothetical protein